MADISTEAVAEALEHSGILRQKWGQRRYQNLDGTYTELGKERKREYYRDKYANYTNEELNAMTARNNAINNYEQSLVNKGNASTHRMENAAKKTESTKKVIVGTAAILAGATALVVAGQKFKNDWSAGGAGREAAKDLKKSAADLLKKGKEVAKNLSASVKHSAIDEEYLAHHGILGQKWGVRRYQNEDGTLTPLGRKRYGVKSYNELSAAQKKDIDKRDAELRTRYEADYEAKRQAKQEKREYKLEKKRLKNDAKEIKEEAKIEKAEIESQREERLQAETQAKAARAVKMMGIGLAAATVVLGAVVAKKAFSSGSSSSVGEITGGEKVGLRTKAATSSARSVSKDIKQSIGKIFKFAKSESSKVKVSQVKVKDVVNSANVVRGKDAAMMFRDSDGIFKSAADIIKNHQGQLRLPAP